MTKVVLSDLTSLANEASAIGTLNNNSNTIEQAFDNTLSRNGAQPNEMKATLDMNSNAIINLPPASLPHSPIRLKDADGRYVRLSGSDSVVTTFATESIATAQTIASSVDFIRTQGKLAIGDGGGATYRRVSAQPVHSFKLSTNGGTIWWERIQETYGVHFRGDDYLTDGIIPQTVWIEFDSLCQPGIVTRETLGGTASFTRQYMREKMKALYDLGGRRFIVMYISDQGRTYTNWTTTPVNPSGVPFHNWWNDVSVVNQPNVDNFDVLKEMFEIFDGLEGSKVVISPGRHDDVQLLNDMYNVEFLLQADPNRFGKTLATRKTEEIARYTNEGAELFGRFGYRPSWGGWYIAHESDHIQSSANLYNSINTALKAYVGERHVSTSTPIDMADTNTIADKIIEFDCTDLWEQSSAGYGYNWSTGKDAYVSGISILGSVPWFTTYRALINRCRTRPSASKTPRFGVVIEVWRRGVTGTVNLTLSATSGSGVTVTAASATFASTDVGRIINARAGLLNGRATITGFTSSTVVTVTVTETFSSTSVVGGFWAFEPDPNSPIYPVYPGLASEAIIELNNLSYLVDQVSLNAEGYTDPGNLSLRLRQSQANISNYRDLAEANWNGLRKEFFTVKDRLPFFLWNSRTLSKPAQDSIYFFDMSGGAASEGQFQWLTAGTGLNITGTSINLTSPETGVRNHLINGGMRFNQRAPATNADDTYSFDRWNVLTQTGTVAITSQSDIENGWPNALRMTQSQATAQRMGLEQIVESSNCKHLRGQSVNLQARVRSSASLTLRYAILEWTGTANTVTSDVVNDWTSTTFTTGNFFLGSNLTVTATGNTALVANTPATINISGTVGSSANNLIVFLWTEFAAAQNTTLDVGKVQLEPGSTPTIFENVPLSTEEILCKRYYQILPRGTFGESESTTVAMFGTVFSPQMRIAPTLTLTLSAPVLNIAGGATVTGASSTIASSGITASGCYFRINGFTGLTAGFPHIFSTDGIVVADSEL